MIAVVVLEVLAKYNVMLVPIQLENAHEGVGSITLRNDGNDVEELTLKILGIKEAVLEEFVRKNIQALFPEGETLLIVGQQPKNKAGGRADLVAVDGKGNIVLVEIKRDVEDIVARKEPFEFQAIRYAANYALITTPQDLIQKLFAPYIEKHKGEYELHGLTSSELASRLLLDYLKENNAENTFNAHQRIVLIASAFDPQTRSACAWLAKNKIDIRCLQLSPIKYKAQHFFNIDQIIPPPSLDQYFVEIADPSDPKGKTDKQKGSSISKANLPKMPQLFEWKLVAPGDPIYIKGHELDIARIRDQYHVEYHDQPMTYNAWGQKVTSWSAINIYEWTIHKPTGQTLDELRRSKQEQIEQELVEPVPDTMMGLPANAMDDQ